MIARITATVAVAALVAPSLTLELVAFEGLVLAITHYLEQQC